MMRPTFRNLTDSFEGWAYRNGFKRQLDRLAAKQFLESQGLTREPDSRVVRLTETGRLHALGGRDPERQWRRDWDGTWRAVLFDLPNSQNTIRDRFRAYLRNIGFGCLQRSVWITPDPLDQEKLLLSDSKVNVNSLILLEFHPCAGESNHDIVQGAWNFEEINQSYANYLAVLRARPTGVLSTSAKAEAFLHWIRLERSAWLAAIARDPLLPAYLLPQGYLGRDAWKARLNSCREATAQCHGFRP